MVTIKVCHQCVTINSRLLQTTGAKQPVRRSAQEWEVQGNSTQKPPKGISFSFLQPRRNDHRPRPWPVPGSSRKEVNKINQRPQIHKGRHFSQHTPLKRVPSSHPLPPWEILHLLPPPSRPAGLRLGSLHCQKHPSELDVSFNSQDCSGNIPLQFYFLTHEEGFTLLTESRSHTPSPNTREEKNPAVKEAGAGRLPGP